MAAEGIRIPIMLVDQFSSGLKDVEGKLGGFQKTVENVGRALAAAFTVRALWNLGKDMVKSFQESEAAIAKFESALRATGSTSRVSSDAISKLANETQKYTAYSDEATLSAATMLHQLTGMGQEMLQRSIPVVQDLAAAMGMDLESAATIVAKAMAGNTAGLSRYGIAVKEGATQSETMTNVLTALDDKFNGMAKTIGDTAAGKVIIFQNALDGLKEAGGEFIASFLTPLVEALTKVAAGFSNAIDMSKAFTAAVKGDNEKASVAQLEAQLKSIDNMQNQFINDWGAKESPFSKAWWAGLVSQTKLWTSGAANFFDSDAKILDKLSMLRTETLAALTGARSREAAGAAAGGGGGGGAAGSPGWLSGSSADYQPLGMTSAMRGALRAEAMEAALEAASRFVAMPKGHGRAIDTMPGEEAMATYLSSKAIADEQKDEDKIEKAMIRALKASASGPAPAGPTLFQRATAGLSGAASGGLTGKMVAGAAEGGGGALGPLMDALSGITTQFGSLMALMDPLNVILKAFFEAIAPVLNELLGPLVGILAVVGQLMAAIIAPMLKALAPIIKSIAEGFIWLYNKALIPIANAFIKLGVFLAGLATMIFYIVTFQWGKIGKINFAASDESMLKPINMGTLEGAGADASGTQNNSSWSTGRQLTFNIYVNAQVIAGDPGIRNLAILIRDEIRAAEALGY